MPGFTCSQSTLVIVAIVTIVLYFAANTGITQNAFIYAFSIAITLLIVDLLFMNEKTFEYEPHYQNWQRKRQAQG